MLLESFPEARNIICEWAESDLASLSCESLALFVRNESTNRLYEKIGNCELTFNDFEQVVNVSNFSVSTATRYLDHLGFRYCEQKKTYYSDKHENEENVRDRIEYIKNILIMRSILTFGCK